MARQRWNDQNFWVVIYVLLNAFFVTLSRKVDHLAKRVLESNFFAYINMFASEGGCFDIKTRLFINACMLFDKAKLMGEPVRKFVLKRC